MRQAFTLMLLLAPAYVLAEVYLNPATGTVGGQATTLGGPYTEPTPLADLAMGPNGYTLRSSPAIYSNGTQAPPIWHLSKEPCEFGQADEHGQCRNNGFMVRWAIESWEQVPCPKAQPDPWTGAVPPGDLAMSCGQMTRREMRRWFSTEDGARAFVKTKPADVKALDLTISAVHP